MTKIEKIDYLREIEPFYQTNSIIFAMSEKKLDEAIAKAENKGKEIEEVKEIEKSAKQVYYENVVPRKIGTKYVELKKQNKQLMNKLSKVQLENLGLKEKIKKLEKKIKKVKEILNAKD